MVRYHSRSNLTKLLGVFSLVLTTSFLNKCDSKAARLEQDLKHRIARASDTIISEKNIKLSKEEGYYIASRRDENPTYYFLVKEINGQYDFTHVLTDQSWVNNKAVNKAISSAMVSLSSHGLALETIYDHTDSIGMTMIDKNKRFLHSHYIIKQIDSIISFESYKLDTCFVPGCEVVPFGRK